MARQQRKRTLTQAMIESEEKRHRKPEEAKWINAAAGTYLVLRPEAPPGSKDRLDVLNALTGATKIDREKNDLGAGKLIKPITDQALGKVLQIIERAVSSVGWS